MDYKSNISRTQTLFYLRGAKPHVSTSDVMIYDYGQFIILHDILLKKYYAAVYILAIVVTLYNSTHIHIKHKLSGQDLHL